MNPLGAAGGRAGPRAGGRPRAREGPLEARPPPPPPRPQRVPAWCFGGGLSCDQGRARLGERLGAPAFRAGVRKRVGRRRPRARARAEREEGALASLPPRCLPGARSPGS